MRESPPANKRTALYRHFDRSGTLLYVGVSLNALSRLTQHREGSEWFDKIANVTIDWFDDRRSALDAEKEAIRLERPLFNIKGQVGGKIERAAWFEFEWLDKRCGWEDYGPPSDEYGLYDSFFDVFDLTTYPSEALLRGYDFRINRYTHPERKSQWSTVLYVNGSGDIVEVDHGLDRRRVEAEVEWSVECAETWRRAREMRKRTSSEVALT